MPPHAATHKIISYPFYFGPSSLQPAPPAGSGAEPQPPTILVHFRLKRVHLVLYNLAFSGKLFVDIIKIFDFIKINKLI